MKTRSILTLLAAAMAATAAQAATFTPSFTDVAAGNDVDISADINAVLASRYGLEVSNAFFYQDARDGFDGVGLANGLLADAAAAFPVGRIRFLDTTDMVSVDYLTVDATVYRAFGTAGQELGSFRAAPGASGRFTLGGVGQTIVALTWTAPMVGFGAVSGLTYDYDGITGGGNTDLLPAVPEPASLVLMVMGLGMLAALARRR